MITLIIVIACWALAAGCNAVMDVLNFKFKTSVFNKLNPDYWNPAKSWRNKYKNKMAYQGPAFIGSTTFLSFLTDAWHLFQFLSNSLQALSVVFVFEACCGLDWYYNLALFLALKATWGIIFEPLYRTILRR